MVQSSKATFFFGVIVFSALLNDSISHARRDIFIHGNKEESIINEKETSDKEMNKITTIADTKTERFKERERMLSSHDTFAGLKCETRDAGDQIQVSGANNSARKCFRGTKEDMKIGSAFKPSSNVPGNTINGETPFTSDYHSIMNHPPRHN